VRLEIVTAQTRRINRFVLERRLDAAIAIEADPRSLPKDLTAQRIAAVELALLAPWKHRLSRKPSVAPAELRDERLIAIEPDIGYGPIAAAMFAGHGVSPHVVARADDIETVKLMVAARVGVAVLPRNCATNEIALKQLRAIPIRPVHEVHVTLLRHPDPVSPAATSCLDLLGGAAAKKPR
jgi:DNA-binding transcriptional LysR family regulator